MNGSEADGTRRSNWSGWMVGVAAGLFVTSPAWGADPVGIWMDAARSNNAAIREARAAYAAALAEVPQARALPDPRVEVETMGTDAVSGEQIVRLAQAFPWPGVLGARGRMTSLQAQAMWHEIQAMELAVLARIQAIAAELSYLRKETGLVRENLRLFEEQEDFLEQMSRGGGEVTELVRVEMESSLLADDLLRLGEMERREVAELEELVGAPVGRGWVERVTLAETGARLENEAALVASLPARSPTLQALERRVEAARSGERLARLERWPEFMVSGGFRRRVETAMTGERDVMDEGVLMMSVSVPIWGAKNRGAVDEAAALVAEAKEEYEAEGRRLKARVAVLMSRRRDSARRAALFRDRLLPKARQAQEAVEASYRSGAASLVDVFEARRRLLTVQTGLWRSVADGAISTAELGALFGTPIQGETK